MVDHATGDQASSNTDVAADMAEVGSRLDKERQALSETLGEARDTVTAGVKELGNQAAESVNAQAESVKDEAAAGLASFSDALKAASAQLSGEKVGFAGDLVQQAAGGLENLARSIEGRSPAEILDEMRSFGRQNPIGFLAGSVLAGFALGRVATAALAEEGTSHPAVASSTPSMTGAPVTSYTPASVPHEEVGDVTRDLTLPEGSKV